MRASSINFNESLELWNNVSVKIPSIEHAQQIFDIVRKAWLDTYPNDEYWITRNDIEKKFVDKCERIKQAIEWYNNENCGWIATLQNEVVWYTYVKLKNWLPHLFMLYVNPDFQWNWVWSALMNRVFEFFSKYDEIYLDVASYNQQAISFYEKMWFEKTWIEWTHDIIDNKEIPTIQMKCVLWKNH